MNAHTFGLTKQMRQTVLYNQIELFCISFKKKIYIDSETMQNKSNKIIHVQSEMMQRKYVKLVVKKK